jgi:hypothetical protein
MTKAMKTLPFRELYFGKSDSRNEAAYNQDAFVKSYVDLRDLSTKVIGGSKFLVLGPKGTGKSALAWYLSATEPGSGHLTLIRDASLLPLAEIPRLQTGQPEGPQRTVAAWKFILLCNYLELLLRDQSSSLQRNAEVLRVTKLLREYGFMGDAYGRALVNASTSTFTIPIPKLGEIYRRERGRGALNIFHLLPYLEQWSAEADAANRHTLILDGLDSILLNDVKYNESLASLTQAAYFINQTLRSNGSSGSIVLLLRNDIFSRISLSLPDSQKMRDDFAADLDWRILSGDRGRKSPLIQLVNQKASNMANGRRVDVLSYFDRSVRVGGRGSAPKSIKTLPYFLNLTRHTPRDLLRLLDSIREVELSDASTRDRRFISGAVVREGVLQYSTKYFVNAILNEFAGFDAGAIPPDLAVSVLKHIGKQRFTRDDFVLALRTEIPEVHVEDVNRVLRLLFFAGALGNSVNTGTERYMQFYHRRDDVEIYLGGQFILHNALMHAWSIPFAT